MRPRTSALNQGASDRVRVCPPGVSQVETLKEENDSLRCQLDAYRNEVELLKQEQGKNQPIRSEEDTTHSQQLSFLQQALQGMQKVGHEHTCTHAQARTHAQTHKQTHTRANAPAVLMNQNTLLAFTVYHLFMSFSHAGTHTRTNIDTNSINESKHTPHF